MTDRVRELRPPIGKYRIVGLIGTGGMGVVYRGYDPDLDREVAVKVLKSGVLERPDHLERFKRECRAAAKLSHAGVVHVYDTGVLEGSPYLVMELVEGTSLALKLVEGRMAVETAAEIAGELCEAVQYLHDHHVIHRDIKPSNIIITPTGRVKLLDFGLAVVLEETRAITMTGEAIGTPRYMAPEQLESDHEKINERTDVYAIGAVLYETLTGKPPVDGPNLYAVLHAIRTAAPSAPSAVNPDVPPSLDAIVLKCLSKSGEDRYAAAADVRRALQARQKDAPTVRRETVARPAPTTPIPTLDDGPVRIRRHGQRRRRKLDPKLIAAIVVLAAVPAAAVLMSRPWENANDPGVFVPKPIEVRLREDFQRILDDPAKRQERLRLFHRDVEQVAPESRSADVWMWEARALRFEGRFQQAFEAAEAGTRADAAHADVAAERDWCRWIAQDLLLHGFLKAQKPPEPRNPEQIQLIEAFESGAADFAGDAWAEFTAVRAIAKAKGEIASAREISEKLPEPDSSLLEATLQMLADQEADARLALQDHKDWRFDAARAALLDSGAEFDALAERIPRDDLRARLRGE